jgi:hypothetical protein
MCYTHCCFDRDHIILRFLLKRKRRVVTRSAQSVNDRDRDYERSLKNFFLHPVAATRSAASHPTVR